MKKWFLFFVLCFVLTGCSVEPESPAAEEPPVESPSVDEIEPTVEAVDKADGLAFLDDLAQCGYTVEQLAAMREILVNVGVTEITDLDIGVVTYGMQSITGLAYKDKVALDEVQIRLNIDHGELYYVHIYCPSYYHENSVTYLSGLEDRRAELYYNTKGGYLKKIDWENRAVVDYK